MTIDEKDVEPLALAERMDSHMGQADRGALLRDCHLAAAVIRRLAYESAKQKGADGWRDIASAPKDGTEILACSEPAGTGTMLVRYIAMVDFLTDAEIEEYVREGASDSMLEKADWFHADFLHGDRLSPDCYPTKWRPLPEPPSALLSAAGEE